MKFNKYLPCSPSASTLPYTGDSQCCFGFLTTNTFWESIVTKIRVPSRPVVLQNYRGLYMTCPNM